MKYTQTPTWICTYLHLYNKCVCLLLGPGTDVQRASPELLREGGLVTIYDTFVSLFWADIVPEDCLSEEGSLSRELILVSNLSNKTVIL